MKKNNQLKGAKMGIIIFSKKMNLKILFLFFVMFFTIFSCKKEENSEFTDLPIIESYLSYGDYPTVTITRQIPFSTDVTYSTDDINNLIIQLEYNNELHVLTPLGNGLYIDSTTIVEVGQTYNLSFQFNSKKVSAYTYVPSKPSNLTQSETEMYITKMNATSGVPTSPPTSMTMPDPIKINWDNPDGSYYLILVENMEKTLEPIRDFGDKTPPGNIFKKSPTNLATTEVRAMDFQYFGKHRVILYHVLPDYATLYNQTNNSSQNLTNPSTSIVNGYGIFTGLNSDTLYIEVKEQ